MPDFILVDFPNFCGEALVADKPNLVPVPPITAWNEDYSASTKSFPLSLNYAKTLYKVQSLTIPKLVISLPKTETNIGEFYTALSRVRSLNDLLIKDFDLQKFISLSEDKKWKSKVARLKNEV